MKILAVDTSANTATVCVVDEDKLIAERTVNYKKTHSETLMPMIDGTLKDAGLDITDIDVFSVADGPGSFTGLRIGVSAVKGMAHALDKPIVTISTLEAMAYGIYMSEDIISPIMDARRNQVYNGVYTWCDGKFSVLSEPRALSIEECVEDLLRYKKRVIFLGDGVPVHKEYITSKMGDMAVFAPPSVNGPRASALASLVGEHEKKTCFEVAPLYLRKPQAERELEERSKKE